MPGPAQNAREWMKEEDVALGRAKAHAPKALIRAGETDTAFAEPEESTSARDRRLSEGTEAEAVSKQEIEPSRSR
jgi:hypothetical protein